MSKCKNEARAIKQRMQKCKNSQKNDSVEELEKGEKCQKTKE